MLAIKHWCTLYSVSCLTAVYSFSCSAVVYSVSCSESVYSVSCSAALHMSAVQSLAPNQTLQQSYRAGVWRLSHWLCPRREESPAQRKVGEPHYRSSLDQLFVQHKYTVTGKMAGNHLQLQLSSLQGPSTLRGPPD